MMDKLEDKKFTVKVADYGQERRWRAPHMHMLHVRVDGLLIAL